MTSKEEALACARAYVREPFLRREKEADVLAKSIYVTAHQLACEEAKERADEIDRILSLALSDENPVIYIAGNSSLWKYPENK